MISVLESISNWAGDVAQQAKVLASNPDFLSSNPRIVVGGENGLL